MFEYDARIRPVRLCTYQRYSVERVKRGRRLDERPLLVPRSTDSVRLRVTRPGYNVRQIGRTMSVPKEPTPAPKGGPNGTAAAGAAAGGGWFSSFMKGPQGKAVSNFSNMVKDKVGKMKVAMPVDVKVDFLKPTMETIRESANNVWVQLPPQAQVAAPYVVQIERSLLSLSLICLKCLRSSNDVCTLQI